MSASVPEARHNDNKEGLRVLMLGATGTAGRATTEALVRAGHNVTCLVRKRSLQQHDATVGHNAQHAEVAANTNNASNANNAQVTQITQITQITGTAPLQTVPQ